jgi:hypothetical protein
MEGFPEVSSKCLGVLCVFLSFLCWQLMILSIIQLSKIKWRNLSSLTTTNKKVSGHEDWIHAIVFKVLLLMSL